MVKTKTPCSLTNQTRFKIFHVLVVLQLALKFAVANVAQVANYTPSTQKMLPSPNAFKAEAKVITGQFRKSVAPKSYTDAGSGSGNSDNVSDKSKRTTAPRYLTSSALAVGTTGNRTLYSSVTPTVTTEIADIKLFFHNCTANVIHVVAQAGKVNGMYGDRFNFVAGTKYICDWYIEIPKEFKFMYVLIAMPEDPCTGDYKISRSSGKLRHNRGFDSFDCDEGIRQLFFEADGPEHFYFRYNHGVKSYHFMPNVILPVPKFTVEFQAYNEDIRTILPVTFHTPTSGYITQWGFSLQKHYLCINNASYTLQPPDSHMTMLSFSHFDMNLILNDCPNVGLWLYYVESSEAKIPIRHWCGKLAASADLFFSTLLFHFKTKKFCSFTRVGFRAFFSFHHLFQIPQKFRNSLFNCSVPHYHLFKKHLDCNLEEECAGHEDEGGHCPYSSALCKGAVSSGTRKCYSYISRSTRISFYAAERECLKRGGNLAMMKTVSELEDFQQFFKYGKFFHTSWIGVRSGDITFPSIYKHMMKWIDRSIAQTVHVMTKGELKISFQREHELCALIQQSFKLTILFETCVGSQSHGFYCQHTLPQRQTKRAIFPKRTFPYSWINKSSLRLSLCNHNQVTHAFLFCDLNSPCGSHENYLHVCRLPNVAGNSDEFSVAMFECDDATMTLHYTQVCNAQADCPDESDETFCVHEDCAGFQCDSGQCVEKQRVCDSTWDCLDKSDELLCDSTEAIYIFPHMVRIPTPVSIDFTEEGVIQTAMKDSEPCADTHFRCFEHYCLPVYLYCNAVVDCPDGEDERDCDSHTCPGFYRCLASSVCVHADHLCDGWHQCPQRDDEWLCQLTCPDVCACQGYAFVCPSFFHVPSNPQLRYLDASGSGMKPHHVTGVLFLVWLSLARCGVDHVSQMNLPKLRTLVLANNLLTSIHMEVFMPLTSLKSLILTRNPVVQLHANSGSQNHSHLQFLDLSWTNLINLSSQVLSGFPQILKINISFSKINTIHDGTFSSIPRLQNIDLRGNPLSSYPDDLLKGLSDLQRLYTDDFRLCCQQSLPPTFTSENQCLSPKMQLSSCQNLIRYTAHRALMSVFMFLSMVGNTSCLILKMCVKRNALSSSLDFLVINLSVMDLLMGAYITMITVTDWTYRQRYFFVRRVWTSSVACQMSGFLALLSFEGTLFTVSFMTVHSLISSYSHRLSIRVTQRRVRAVCFVIWALAFLISFIPLVRREWKVHGHTDNCLAMPTSVDSVAGRVYAFATLVVVHVVLGCLTCVGQVSVLWVKYFHDDLTLSITERSLKTTQATRLLSVVSLDCIRRLAFCLLVLMGQTGLMTGDQIHVMYSFFVVPVNSAVNPLLYMISVLQEKQRLVREQRLMQRLALRLQHQRHG